MASWGLEQPSDLSRPVLHPHPARSHASDSDLRSERRTVSLHYDSEGGDRRDSLDSSLPEIIREVPEPESPEDAGYTEEQETSKDSIRDTLAARTWRSISVSGDHSSRDDLAASSSIPAVVVEDTDTSNVDETTALLPKASLPSTGFRRAYKDPSEAEEQPSRGKGTLREISLLPQTIWSKLSHPKTWSPKAVGSGVLHGGTAIVTALPAVFLGWLLNVLDALSYGTILFPLGESIFEDTGPDGIAIFFVSTVIAQLVYSSRSRFKGGVGSEMIEVVPFFHKMAYLIMADMEDASTESIMATVYISYCLSSILTGVIFLLLGLFKLGNLVSFFPRSILTGCIGGVGVFLFITGIEVSAGISGNLDYNWATLQKLVALDTLPLWTVPLLLAVILFVIKLFSERPWILPAYFISIMAIFYIVVAATPNLSLEQLRDSGWVFEKPQSGVAFYHFYSFYSKPSSRVFPYTGAFAYFSRSKSCRLVSNLPNPPYDARS